MGEPTPEHSPTKRQQLREALDIILDSDSAHDAVVKTAMAYTVLELVPDRKIFMETLRQFKADVTALKQGVPADIFADVSHAILELAYERIVAIVDVIWTELWNPSWPSVSPTEPKQPEEGEADGAFQS